MLLGDRNHLATRGKICSSGKANQKDSLRCPSLKLHLASHRHLPEPLQIIVLLQWVQQARSRNLLPPARIPRGGLVWCFLSAVLLLQRDDSGDAAHEQQCKFFVFQNIHNVNENINERIRALRVSLPTVHLRGRGPNHTCRPVTTKSTRRRSSLLTGV